ncbi:MAG TPA: YfiR family protein [Rhizomicrobium sp.]
MLAGHSQGGTSPPLELAAKATSLVKFAPFVDWPAAVFSTPDSPVTICVMDDDPLAPLVQQAASGQKAGNRALAVQRISPNGSADGCQIFYFEPDSQAGADIAEALRNRPVLTVTSSDSDVPKPAIITFSVDQNRVRFDIDNIAAAHAGLEIGSSLLALARNVKRVP